MKGKTRIEMISSFLMKLKDKAAVLALALVMVLGLAGMPVETMAAVGQVPVHTKNITDNHDGTYTISLDVVGDSEKQPNNVNVIVIFDRSGSMTSTRMNAAKTAVNNLANSLFAYNTTDAPNTVQMALVSFSTNATISRTPTTSANQFRTAVNNLSADGGTNWEAALDEAGNVNFGDDDQTFVVFVSDGNPTFRDTRITTDYLPRDNPRWNTQQYNYYRNDNIFYNSDGVYGLGSDNSNQDNYSPASMTRCYNAALPEAQALVSAVGGDNFFTIGAYGDVSRMQTLTTAAGAPAGNFYNANDTAALNQALSDILAKIEMMGIGNTSIDDGTTNQVTTTSGEVAELLEVDENSYKYYRSGGTYGTMQEWTDAPEAKFEGGSVKWDLASEGVLENGVRYTVTFDCYPSQETYDTIAQLKNGDLKYSDLDSEIQKYIVDNGNGSYSLRTNTNASLSWDDTRDEAGQQTSDYTNPDPVKTDASTLTAVKEWEGGEADTDSVEMTILMDDKPFHTTELTAAGGWSTSSFISYGLIKNGTILPGAEGHDFKFAELGATQYHWELETPTVHPMIINGTPTMLVMVDDDHPASGTTYTINGKTYYVDTNVAGLTATNHRRSNLNLTKVVTGEDAPKDAKFPFELTVNNSKAPASAPSDSEDPKHESDYWIWLSVRDETGKGVTGLNLGSGVVEDSGGYYYAPNGTTFSLEIGAGWGLRFLNLPSGTTYTFKEGDLPEGFAFESSELTAGTDSTFSGDQTTTGTIENTKTSYSVTYTNDYALTDLEITKVWEDADNQDGKRLTADEFKAILTLAPAVEGKEPTVVDNGDNTYTITYTGLPRYNNGEEVKYTVDEGEIDGYTTAGSPAEDHGTITNTHTPEKTEIFVKKEWIGPAAESVTVTLYADGTETDKTLTLNADNQWAGSFTDLDKYKDGEEIAYTVTESELSGYTPAGPTGTGTENDPFLFKNTNDETTEIFVKKVWVGPEATATIHLLADGKATDPDQSITLPQNGSNEGSFTELRKYDATDGHEIKYTVSEDAIANYTTTGPVGTGTQAAPFTFTNTNNERVSVPVSKVWDDADNQDGIRPGSVTVNLLADGTAATQDGITASQTLNEENKWQYTWQELYKYDQSTGAEITYTVTEDAVANYTTTMSGNVTNGIVFTNSYTPGKTSVTVTKAWDDENDQDGIRPESVEVTLLADGTAVSQEGITAAVTLNEENKWTYTWSGLNQKKAGTDIVYTVAETETRVITGTDGAGTYAYEITGDAETGYTVTNTHTPETVEVPVNKVWVDENNQDGIRPTSVEVGLKANGETVTQEGISAAVTLNEDNEWAYTWTGLNKYAAGVEIEYTVVETTTDVITGTDGAGTYAYEITGDEEAGYTVTNTHTPETVEVPVEKVWADANNQDGIRPANVTVTLMADGAAVSQEGITAAQTLSESNEWKYTWTGLNKYKDGKAISYTVEETKTDVITGTDGVGTYAIAVTGSAADGYTVTNTHTPEELSIPVEKVWVDTNNQDGFRPTSVEVTLLADGQAVTQTGITAKQTLNEENKWAYTWTGLHKYVDGKAVTYTVEETKTNVITGTDGPGTYAIEITGSAAEGYNVTNTHTPEETSVSVNKVWLDQNNQAKTRPENISVVLLANGANAGEQTLNEANQWTYTWEKLPVYSNGTKLNYTVQEVKVDKYATSISGDAASGYTITNKNTSVELPVTKSLSVPTGAAGPDITGKFTFTLAASGNAPLPETTSYTNPDANGGSMTFGPIVFTEAGTYTYTVEESGTVVGVVNDEKATRNVTVTVTEDASGALSATVNSADGLTFVNTFNPATLTVAGSKKIIGRDMTDGETFTFTLAPTGDTVAAVEKGEVVMSTAASTATVSGAKDGAVTSFTFGSGDDPIQFTKVGEYTFSITETNDGKAGMTYDTSRSITVTVSNENGILTASYVYNEPDPVFVNTYKADGTATLSGTKRLVYEVDDSSDETTSESEEGGTKIEMDNADGTLVIVKDANKTEKDLSLEGGEFKFEVRYASGSDTNTVIATGTNGKAAAGTPATITFTPGFSYTTGEEGTTGTIQNMVKDGKATKTTNENGAAVYTIDYVVTEVKSDNPAMQGNTQTFTITVTLTDNLAGTLESSVSSDVDVEFKNYYVSNVANVSLEGLKVLQGDRPLAAGEFTFTVTGDGPLPESTTASNEAGGAVKFGNIKFTKDSLGDSTDKTFTYTITEQPGSIPGVTYDTTGKTVTIAVHDDGKGNITATTSPASAPLFTATNTYTPTPVSGQIGARKELVGRPLEAGEFTFTLSDADGNVVSTKENDADGNVLFDAVEFTKAGDYTYTIAEVNNGLDRVTYDTNTYSVTAHVTNNYTTGGLDLEWIIGSGSEIVFHNTYAPRIGNLSVTKVVTGEGADLTKSFDFTVTLGDASINGAYGGMTFTNGVAQFSLTNGQTLTATGLPENTTYTVTEADYSAEFYTTTIENGSGTIPLDGTAAATFTNYFQDVIGGSVVSPVATKYFENGTMTDGEFSFEIKDESGKVVSTGTNDADGNITFKPIAYGKESLAGEASKSFTYTVYEVIPAAATAENEYTANGITYDTSVKTIHVDVSRDENGQVAAVLTDNSDKLTFTNVGETLDGKTVSAKKLWADEVGDELEWPEGVTVKVELLADGQATGMFANLTAANPEAAFANLSNDVTYTIREAGVTGLDGDYTAAISGDDEVGFTVTNTVVEPKRVSVLKTWEDSKGRKESWPKKAEVIVELLADGQPTGRTAKLTADSPSAVFEDLDTNVTYSVRENSVKGVSDSYEVSITGDETDGFTITNSLKPPKETEPPTGIRTGDNTPILPYLATLLGALLIAITAGMGFGLKRRSR